MASQKRTLVEEHERLTTPLNCPDTREGVSFGRGAASNRPPGGAPARHGGCNRPLSEVSHETAGSRVSCARVGGLHRRLPEGRVKAMDVFQSPQRARCRRASAPSKD